MKMRWCLGVLLTGAAMAQDGAIPAFPGAEGFGATTPGGRGGRVMAVTTLADGGAGSLREAVEAKGPRIVVFRVAGWIDLTKPLRVKEPRLTIAGQSAPGGGAGLRYYPLVIETEDVVVRHLRVRLGDVSGKEADAVSIASGSRRVILDHVSASWSVDEALSPSGDIADVTVQWSIIAEGLQRSVHSKGKHGYGSLVRATGGVSLHHNLWAHHTARNPRLGDNYGRGAEPVHDVRENVMYNWGDVCTGMVDGRIRVNYTGNYLRPGPSSKKGRPPIALTGAATEATRFYVSGNTVETRADLTADNGLLFGPLEVDGKKRVTIVDRPFDAPPVERRGGWERVLAEAGATRPKRDAVDERVVRSVRERTGRLIDSQKDVGGWPEFAGGAAPVDTDGDGMADEWEKKRGLDPKDGRDGGKTGPGGYTWIEVYLNELAQ